jgi:hypothetical protein
MRFDMVLRSFETGIGASVLGISRFAVTCRKESVPSVCLTTMEIRLGVKLIT